MGYQLQIEDMKRLFDRWKADYTLLGPRRMAGEGMYSDTDVIRYGELENWEDLEWNQRSHYSFKEAVLPITQILFYFTEETVTEAQAERRKPALIFLRSCDIHAIKRLDEIYLRNRFEDQYYRRLRDNIKLVLMSCPLSCGSGFCVSMGTNRTEDYDAAVSPGAEGVRVISKWAELDRELERLGAAPVDSQPDSQSDFQPDFPEENAVKVEIPEHLDSSVIQAPLWKEYDSRCINCGRCNFVCPTCTCFTMQDIYYTDNGRAGERRRVHASCMVDGYTDVAGGGCYRKANGERMRFKVLHKISDFKKQFGYQMCVGCGRCDDICPEYISFSACVNRVAALAKEEN
ncbi:MAG: anaerobic sulfite reductase subunit AsrA [Enterocloster asparagiformis]|nr:anaerobic sulfite reductase subunit AsrA [Enterocloster asparagiformis]